MRHIRAVAVALLAAAISFAASAEDKAKEEADQTLSAVVRVKSKIVQGARSAATLGTQREGSGVLVRDGFVVTIGYLVIEAESVEVTGWDGKAVPAALAGYDHASGFGVLKLLAPLEGRPLPLGNARAAVEREPAMIARYGGRDGVSLAYIVSRRQFSGSWEYLLESAIFTYPPVPNWSGAALISAKGELLGIGSLIVNDAAGTGVPSPGNMFVPVDLLKPILDDLIAKGRPSGPARPWLGIYAEETHGRLFVTRVSPEGPADRAGVRAGDIVISVGSEKVSTLAEFYRKIWALGAAGTEVQLKVLQGAQINDMAVRSIDRIEYFRQKPAF